MLFISLPVHHARRGRFCGRLGGNHDRLRPLAPEQPYKRRRKITGRTSSVNAIEVIRALPWNRLKFSLMR